MAAKRKLIWANMLHLGCNMWDDHPADPKDDHRQLYADWVRCDEKLWRELTERTRAAGLNALVIDLGEGIVYPSHPELAVKGSWEPAKLRAELARLRKMGLEPIPKLNFSACHDVWLKHYSRMLSTSVYRRVAADIIRDVCELFDRPRFFHLGMDEETYAVQRQYEYAVCRSREIWAADLAHFEAAVRRCGSRALMWGDPAWGDVDYARRVPASIVQANWYYWKDVAEVEKRLSDPAFKVKPGVPDWAGQNHPAELKAFLDLDKAGYDQMPCASNWNNPENVELLTDFALRRLSPERLLGFIYATWRCTWDDARTRQIYDDFFAQVSACVRKHAGA